MTKLGKVILPVILVSVLLSVGCSSGFEQAGAERSASAAPQVGRLAPDFQLPSLDGPVVTLSDLRGKPVLINFWATWCGPCRDEMPYLQQIQDGWSGKGLVLLAIDIGENSATVEKFMTELNLSMTVLLDAKQSVAQRYNLTAIPTSFLIDRDGIIRVKRIGAYSSVAEIEESLSKIMP